MVELSKRAIDIEADEKGIWFTYLEDTQTGEKLEFLVAGAKNKRLMQMMTDRTIEVSAKAGISLQSLRDKIEVQKEISAWCDARGMLLGWRGWTENGEPVPYSVEQAEELFKLPKWREVAQAIKNYASNIDHYTVEAVSHTKSKAGSED